MVIIISEIHTWYLKYLTDVILDKKIINFKFFKADRIF